MKVRFLRSSLLEKINKIISWTLRLHQPFVRLTLKLITYSVSVESFNCTSNHPEHPDPSSDAHPTMDRTNFTRDPRKRTQVERSSRRVPSGGCPPLMVVARMHDSPWPAITLLIEILLAALAGITTPWSPSWNALAKRLVPNPTRGLPSARKH